MRLLLELDLSGSAQRDANAARWNLMRATRIRKWPGFRWMLTRCNAAVGRGKPRVALGVQVVAGSNPVAPTVQGPGVLEHRRRDLAPTRTRTERLDGMDREGVQVHVGEELRQSNGGRDLLVGEPLEPREYDGHPLPGRHRREGSLHSRRGLELVEPPLGIRVLVHDLEERLARPRTHLLSR